MMWFSSDYHLFHKNILEYSKRPFKNVIEMNDCIIQNVNDRVKTGDELYFLGDFLFVRDRREYMDTAKKLLDRIRCKNVHLIYGNHDKDGLTGAGFKTGRDLAEVKVMDGGEKQAIVLCHYAMRVWRSSHHGSWHLYGHSHGSLPDDPTSLSFDCGVDCHNFKPLSYDDVKVIMSCKTWKPVDHHGARDFETQGA